MNRHRDRVKFDKAPTDYIYFQRRSFKSWNEKDGWWYQGEVNLSGQRDGRGIIMQKNGSILISHWKRGIEHGG